MVVIVSVIVPDVTGMTLAEAESRLYAEGIAIGSVSYVQSYSPKGTVISQSVEEGLILNGPQGWITSDLVISQGIGTPEIPQ